MRTSKIYILLLTFISSIFISDMNAATSKTPDFAFPKKVSAQAENELSAALKANDGPAITRALIDYYLAQTRISEDNTQKAIKKIEEIAVSSTDPVLKSMLSTLQAEIYNATYQGQRWKFDRRNLPLTPLPDDINEWSGEQFKAKITSLLEKALINEADLKTCPIERYKAVIDFGGNQGRRLSNRSRMDERETIIYYPTLFDFVASKAIENYKSFANRQTLLAWGLLTRHDLYLSFPFNHTDPVLAKILNLYGALLSFHKPGTAPFINTDIERIDFIASHTYSSGSVQDDEFNSYAKRQQLLKDLYTESLSSEYSGDALLAINDYDADSTWLYNAASHNIKAFPAYARINNLRNIMRDLSRQSLSVVVPNVIGPGIEITFDVSMSNVKSGKIYIYNVSSSSIENESYSCVGLPALKPVAVIPVKSELSDIPFNERQKVKYSFPSVGCYIAIPVIDGQTRTKKEWHRKIKVSNYSVAASVFDKTTIWGLNAKTGEPVADAKITLIPNEYRAKRTPKVIGMTGTDGSIICKEDGSVSISKDGDRFAPSIWVYHNDYHRDKKWTESSTGYTSLALYHPGDTVEWMAICYEFENDRHRPLINKTVSAILNNPSGVEIDTLKLTTDSFGRVSGKFEIPKEGLSGNYRIAVNGNYSTVNFKVSDYKLPTFRVILDPVEMDVPTRGDATLRGRIETYAGFPVGDAKLTIKLSASQRMRWWYASSPVILFYTIEATASPEGKIDVTIPKSVLDMSPVPQCVFKAEFAALSSTGETQTASTMFTQGLRYSIRISAPMDIDISQPTTAIKAQVVNYLDSVVEMPIDYAVLRDKAEMLKGTLMPSSPAIDLTSLPSGKYEFRFTLADSNLAMPATQQIVLYRPTDENTPRPDELLWYPSDKVSVRKGENPTWLYAVNCPTNLLVTLHDDTKIISREWVKADAGMHRLPVILPDSIDKAYLEINLTGNYEQTSATINISRDIPEKGIRFVTETFRNRLVPGEEETWTFRIIDETGDGKRSAVILDMYNTALDALATQSWHFRPDGWKFRYNYNWNQSQLGGKLTATMSHYDGKNLPIVTVNEPEFNTYGLSWTSAAYMMKAMNGIRIRGTGGVMSSKAAYASADMVEEEILNTVKTTELSIPRDGGTDDLNVVREHKKEVMVEEAADAEMDSAAGATEQEEKEPKFSFRDRETALAFFKPMLVTDNEGKLSFSFTVPNANTTWGFRALAYTDSLLSTTFASDVVANKPIMVQPNLPRFLRNGDKATVSASIMNGSETEQTVETHVEIFNATDGKTIKEISQTDVLKPNTSAVISIDIDAPSDAPFIGYRVKSSAERFADGEQALIPVLPAISPVIDTYPFYMAPSDKDFSMNLPVAPANARATLQFCDNPTWYVVTALPGILDMKANTANEAAASIFSAAVASGLLRDNPVIGEAIAEWNKSDRSEGMLTSMLERNADLKQVLLSATPWMLDAKSDTECMTRLSLLFDKKTVENTLKANIATLKKLSCENGGWAWFSSYKEPSTWATENVLLLMGKLHRMGYLPQSGDLRNMIISSLKWFDSETEKDFRKYPKSDYTLYVYLRDFYKDFKGAPQAKQSIVSATVQNILAGWKKSDVFEKAVYAQILSANSYRNVASTILTSLREYSEYSPTKGMWWPSLDNMTIWSMGKIGTTAIILDAFSAIEPQCEDIDRIRQWLILQKEAMDWGTSVTTTQAIASILSSSKKWIEPAGNVKISLAGKEVKPEKAERLTGYFRSPVEWAPKPDAKMRISRKGDTPAWGSLFVLYTDSMTSVKAASCPELSIEKSLVTSTVEADGKSKAIFADSLKVGDKVSVTLTLHVDRDMDYVTIVDERPACYEPVDQLPTPLFSEGIYFYRENRDSETRLFINHLPKGTYILTYDVWINNAGTYASGLATIQSQYAPQFTSHTSGKLLNVK